MGYMPGASPTNGIILGAAGGILGGLDAALGADAASGSGLVVNLGGEGEVGGAINQNLPVILDPGWASSASGQSLSDLQAAGNQFVVSSNTELPFATGSVQTVITNSVPVDFDSFLGPGVQSSEVWRILSDEGVWLNNGVPVTPP